TEARCSPAEAINLIYEKTGKRISKNTLDKWIRSEIFPRPEKEVGKGGRGVFGYFNTDEAILATELIQEGKKKGYKVNMLSSWFQELTIQRVKNIYQKLVSYNNYTYAYFPAIYDIPCFLLLGELRDMFANEKNVLKFKEEFFLKNLHPWQEEKKIEAFVLKNILHDLLTIKNGIFVVKTISTRYVFQEIDSLIKKNESTNNTVKEVPELLKKINEIKQIFEEENNRLICLSLKIKAKLAEIEGTYEGIPKENWENQLKKFEGKGDFSIINDIKL
ncbi:MAG: hypothetical protein V1872_13940, partial [bacterium]